MKHLRAYGAGLAVAAIAIAATPAYAADSDLPPLLPYVHADAGYALGSSSGGGDIVNGPGFGGNFGNSVNFGGGFGFKIPTESAPMSDIRLDFTYATNPSLGGGVHTGLLGDGTPLSSPVKLSTQTMLGTVYADFNIDAPVTPFIGIGVSSSSNKVSALVYSNPSGSFATVSGNTRTNLGWTATVGASYPFAPNLNIDCGYRYIRAGNVTGGKTFTDLTMNPPAVSTLDSALSSTMSLHTFTFALRYMF